MSEEIINYLVYDTEEDAIARAEQQRVLDEATLTTK